MVKHGFTNMPADRLGSHAQHRSLQIGISIKVTINILFFWFNRNMEMLGMAAQPTWMDFGYLRFF